MSTKNGSHITLDAATNCLRVALLIAVVAIQTPVLMRALGPEGFGSWQVVLSFTGLLGLLDLGLGTTLVRFVARHAAREEAAERNRVAATLLCVYAGLGLVGGLVALAPLAMIASRDLAVAYVLLTLRSVVLFLPLSMFRGLLFAQEQIHLANACQCVSILIYGVTSIAAITHIPSLSLLAGINLSCMLLEHACYVVLAYRLIPDLTLSPSLFELARLRELVPFGLKQLVIGVARFAELKLAVLLVAQLVSVSAAGVYALALRMVEAVHMLIKQGVNVLAPVFSGSEAVNDRRGIRATFVAGSRYTTLIATVAAVPILISAPELLHAWVGDAGREAAPVLRILIVSTWLSLSQSTASVALAMTGSENLVARSALLATAVNVGASIALSSVLGVRGIALGTLAAVLLVDARILTNAALREAAVTWREYLRVVIGPALACGLVQAFAAAPWLERAGSSLPALVAVHAGGGLASALAYLALFAGQAGAAHRAVEERHELLGRAAVPRG